MLTTKQAIGALDRRIAIESMTTADDDYGALVETWGTYKKVWANVEYATTKTDEVYDAGAELQTAFNRATFTIRALGVTVTEKMRINYNGATWDIMSIAEHGRNAFLKIVAEKRV